MYDPIAGDQQAGTTSGAGRLVVHVAPRVDGTLGEELHVRGLHDPVADGDVADPERAEEVRIGAHDDDATPRWREVQPNVRLRST
jgi:hypothetical protein